MSDVHYAMLAMQSVGILCNETEAYNTWICYLVCYLFMVSDFFFMLLKHFMHRELN